MCTIVKTADRERKFGTRVTTVDIYRVLLLPDSLSLV